MHNWFKRRRNLRKGTRSRRLEKRQAIRRLISESLERRILLTTVTSVDPPQNSLSAAVSTNISATFDENINAGTATSDNFVVHGSQRAAATTVSAAGMTVTADPDTDFTPGELVQVTSTAGIQGATAGVPYVWQFRTQVSSGSAELVDTGQALGGVSTLNGQTGSLGDIDGDGDLDLFYGGNGNNALFLNDGTGIFTDSGQNVGGGNSIDASIGDLDGDGDLDVIVANSNQANAVLLNNGGVLTQSGTLTSNSSNGVELGDLDGDGDLDAMFANRGQPNRVFLNDGSGSFTDSGQTLGNHESTEIEIGDLDGDGDLDAMVGNYYQGNRVWLNDGSGVFTDSGQSIAFNRASGLGLGDMDGDGDLDAVEANISGGFGSRLFLNDGSGVFSDSGQTPGGNRNSFGVAIGDMDGDGDLDFVVSNNQTNGIYLNDGAGIITSPVLQFTCPQGPGAAQCFDPGSTRRTPLGDLDGDGDLDIVSINTSNGNPPGSRVWINQNLAPTVALSIDNAMIAEAAGVATVTATLSAAHSQEVTVELGLSGTATATDDYTTSATQIVIPVGSTTGSVTITAVDDTLDEADETVVVDMTTITNGDGTGQVTTTITDDDDAPLVTLAIDNATLAENGGIATVTATLSAASGQDVTVNLGATGTATDGVDYALSAAEIVIAAGATSGSVTVTATDDALDEPDETVILDVTGATGATEDGEQQVTATITDDDEPPTVSLAVDNENIAEDGGVATFTVTLSAASIADNTVNLALSGTATDGTDYNASGTQVVIPAGATSGSITVTSIADLLITEGGETVIVDIDAITGNATEDGVQQATTTIVDDVNGPDVSIAVDNSSIAENGGVATITATLANAFGLDVTIDLGLSGTATSGGDYTASGTQIVVPVGQTTGSITITGVDDAAIEGDETVIVDVAAVVNGNEAGEQQLTITLTDDESPPNVSLSVDNATIAEAGGVAVFTATLSAATERDVTIDLAVSGTATATDDYTLTGTQIVIPAGSTTGSVTATAVDDTADDDAETIVVDIDVVTNANEDGTQQATTTIEDDDEAPPLPPGPTPPNGSHDAAASTVVGYTFGAPIPADAATDQTFTVHSLQTGQLVGGATTVSQSGATALHTPAASFNAGELVHATVTSALGPNATWTFRTAVGGGLGTFEWAGQNLNNTPDENIATYGAGVADFDGDGDLDIFFANGNGSAALNVNRFWTNDGSGVFTDSGQNMGDHNARDIAVGDVDGDGDVDAIVVNDGGQANRVWINDGSGVFTASTFGGNNSERVAIGDVDADGDLDVVVANSNGGNGVYLNDGSGAFSQGGTFDNDPSFGIDLGDLDGDGDLDAVVANGNTNLYANRVFFNNGSGSFTDSGQALTPSFSTQATMGDLDGDGDLDVVITNFDGFDTVWLNDGTGVLTDTGQQIDPATSYSRTTDAQFGDLDADGDLDMVTTSQLNRPTLIWLNDGNAVFTESASLNHPDGGTNTNASSLADINGDGDLDIIEAVGNTFNLSRRPSNIWINQNPVNNVTLEVDPASIAEDAGVATVTATLSAAAGQAVTINLAIGGTATDGADFTASDTQIVIAPGGTSGSVTITAVQDALDEADETVVVDVDSVTGATEQGEQQVTVTITDDDEAPLVSLAVDTATIGEDGGVATATATLSAASGQDVAVTLGATGTATDGDDYALSATEIVIAAGSTSGSVTVTANDDAVDEPDETVILDVTGITGATEDGEQQVTVTITDDDEPPTVSLAVDNENIPEDGGVAIFTVSMSAPSLTDTSVDLAVSGTATGGGTDYNISGTQVVIPAGSTSGSVTVTSVADVLITEGGETVIVDIDAITGNATEDGVQQATTTIVDDVNGPDVTIAVDTNTLAEAGATATVTATLANAFSLEVTIDLGLTGTATGGGTDYDASGTQIVVPVGATSGSVTISSVQDTLIEGDETVIVDVTNVINGNESGDQQVTITITDDETPPTVALSVDNALIPEEAGVAVFTATLSAASELEVVVTLAIGGTATATDDYTASDTTITIPAGSTTGAITVTAVQDLLDDDAETVVVDIDTVTNATEDGDQQATTTIEDDDDAPPLPPGPTPPANSVDNPINTVVGYTFDQNITEGTGTDQTFVVHTSQHGRLVGDATTVTENGPTVQHDPARNFFPGEYVQVTVTSDIMTAGGPAAKRVFEFRTASVGTSNFSESGEILGDLSTQIQSFDVALGDVDGDGDLDAFMANYGGTPANRLYLNDGSGVFTDSGQLIGNHNSRHPSFGDMDGDGDLDVVVPNDGGQGDRVWINDGSGVFSEGSVFGNFNSEDAEIGDFDADGDLDVVVAVNAGPNRVFLNDGTGNMTDAGSFGNDGTFDIEVGDFDNDGDLDAFTVSFYDPHRVWLNNGSGQFSDNGQNGFFAGFRANRAWTIAIGDVDGDGDLDAYVGNSDYPDELWLNEGDGTFTDSGQRLQPGYTTYGRRARDVEFGDFDGDGDLDAFIVHNTFQAPRVWQNDGNGVFTDLTGNSLDRNRNSYGVALGDVNGDGSLDAIVANANNANGAAFTVGRVWLNEVLTPSVSIAIDNDTIDEAGGVATVTATLSAAFTADVTIELAFGGTASAADYTASDTQIVIPAGSTTGSVTVTATEDTTDEPDETVIVDIANVTNGQGAGSVTTTILDNDETVPPDVSIAVDNANIPEEAGVATFTVTLSAATSVDVTVDLALSGTAAASDYTASATQVVIPAGSTSGSITVTAVQDTEDEQNETVIVDIDAVTGGNEAGTQQATTTITDDDGPASFAVSTFEATSTGFNAVLNAAIDVDDLNLYDTSAGLGAADVVLAGATTGPVAGTLVIAADNQTISFIATGGVLAADTYTATLRSAADGFEDTTARLLDGNGDGTAGDDYTSEFTVATPVPNAVTLSLPDIVRGPGQPVNVPADATTGLPLSISEGAGVRNVTVSLDYDPAFLEITAAAVGANMPAGSAVTLDTSTAGTALLTFTSPVDLPAGANTLVDLTAAVPTADANSIYRSKQVLNLHSASVTDGSAANIPVIDDDALHAIEYFADVSGNGRVNAADASQVAQFAALLVDGFAASQNADPIVVGDVSGNGRVNAADASQVAQVAALLPVANIPAVPAGVVSTPITGGPDPKLSLPKDVTAAPGETFTVALELDSIENLQAPNRIGSGSVVVTYDPNVLAATNVTAGSFITSNGWSIVPNIATLGRIIVVAFGTNPVGGQFVDTFLNLQFTVNAAAPAGPTALNIVLQAGAFTELLSESDQPLTLIPPPTAADNDEIDGLVTITGGGPTVSLAVDNASIAEAGGVATFTATLSETVTSDVTVDLGLTGTATDPDDYTASGNQIVIAAGATSGSITVTAVDDTVDDDDETVIVDITNVTGAAENGEQQATTTITDDDEPALPTVSLAVDNADIAEAGGVATFTATLSAAATADVTVDLALSGTATNPDDYTASGTQIVIATGATSGSVTVTAVDDTLDEENETVVADITNVVGATEDGEQQATTTITDDDDPVLPTVSLAVDNADIAEAGGVATFTATLSAAATADVTVDLALSGTATNPDDYTASGTQIVIATGATSGSVTVTAVDDTLDEENETVVADITNVVGATEDGEQQATTTITDDDDPVLPTVSLAVDNEAIAEAGGVATLTATLSAAATADVTVDLGFAGTATNPDDYTASGTQIVIATGATSGSVIVTAVDDTLDDDDETVVVDITNVTGATGTGVATITITDDDDPAGPTVALAVDNEAIAEAGGVATFTATLSAAATADVTVDLGISGTATNPDDYTVSGTQIVIATGATSGSVTVTAVDDTVDDDDETVIVDITNVVGAAEDGEQQATTTITDDDGANSAPVLTDPGTQSLPTTQDTLDVLLEATDPDAGQTLTFSATLESGEYYLDTTLGLTFTGDLYQNFSGISTGGRVNLDEKWLLGGDEVTWYYITPDGNFYEWNGGSVLNRTPVAQLDPATYANPELLYNAQAGVAPPAAVSVTGNTLTINPDAGFVGSFAVNVTVSDGSLDDSQLVLVHVQPNEAPVLTDPGDQTLPTTQDTLDVTLAATDPTGDAITFTATVQTAEYLLDQRIGFQLGPNGLETNWSGTLNEQWVLGDDGETWYFITPDGNLWRWLGGDRDILANAELVAALSPATHADPALLYDAQAGAAAPAVVSVAGNVLTIDPNAGFVGTFAVEVTATDAGGLSDSVLIDVDVTAAPATAGVPSNLGKEEAAAAPRAARPQGSAGLGFQSVDGFAGEEQQPATTYDASVDAALDEDLLDDLLADETISRLLGE